MPGTDSSPASTPGLGGAVGLAGRALLLAAIPLSIVWLPLGKIPGMGNVAASDVALLAVWGLTAVALLAVPSAVALRRPLTIASLAIAIGVLAAFGSELGPGQGTGFLEFMLFMKRFGLASILPLAAVLFRSPAMAGWTRWVSAVAIAGLTAFALLPELQEVLPRPELWDAAAMEDRATGALTNPNDLAYAAVALAILHGALLPRSPTLVDRAIFGVALIGSATCLVLSGSRSGVLGAVVALLFITLLSKASNLTKVALIAIAAVTLVAGVSTSDVFQRRLSSAYRQGLRDENVHWRLEAQDLAMRTSLANPFGVGFMNFQRATAKDGSTHFALRTADSVYFDTLLGAGFLGLVAFLWLVRTAWTHVGCSGARDDRRAVALKGGLLAFLVFGAATVVPISIFMSPLFFSIVGAAAYRDDDAS